MKINEILFEIQQRLKSNKDCFNDFAKFAYRNIEGILAELKPLLAQYKCTITFNDEIVNIGGYNYIKSTAILTSQEGESVSATSWAREDIDRAGMMAGQMTGCSSSYSRKYALCGLCAINEEKDLDSVNDKPKISQVTDSSDKSNIELFKEFCSRQKMVESVDLNRLQRFYKHYSPLMGSWTGKVMPQKLFDSFK